jgi:hypothetical protein
MHAFLKYRVFLSHVCILGSGITGSDFRPVFAAFERLMYDHVQLPSLLRAGSPMSYDVCAKIRSTHIYHCSACLFGVVALLCCICQLL